MKKPILAILALILATLACGEPVCADPRQCVTPSPTPPLSLVVVDTLVPDWGIAPDVTATPTPVPGDKWRMP